MLGALSVSACDAVDTRENRLAAIREVEHACGLPRNSIDRSVAERPSGKGKVCDVVSASEKCHRQRTIELGEVMSGPLLCRFTCVRQYESGRGYSFNLHLHGFTVADSPIPDRCNSNLQPIS
jgi:hypothetical protein